MISPGAAVRLQGIVRRVIPYLLLYFLNKSKTRISSNIYVCDVTVKDQR